MTNEELFLTKRLANALNTRLFDIVPHTGEGDDILLSRGSQSEHSWRKIARTHWRQARRATAGNRHRHSQTSLVKALIVFGEDATKLCSATKLPKWRLIVAMNILPNATTKLAHVVLPGSGFAEKRGSMINTKGRVQRLNARSKPPGEARDEWEILRDLIQGVSGPTEFT